MNKRPMSAALILPLVFIAPAGAQGPAGGRSDLRIVPGTSSVQPIDARSSYLPLSGGSGVRVASTPMVEQDGSAVFRNTLVGSWTMSPGVNVGLGLIQVTRMSHKAPALRRVNPLRTEPERDRIVAVGLSIDF